MQIGRATVETSMNVPQKLKIIKLLCNAAISLLGIYLNKMKMLTQKKGNPMVIYKSQNMEII